MTALAPPPAWAPTLGGASDKLPARGISDGGVVCTATRTICVCECLCDVLSHPSPRRLPARAASLYDTRAATRQPWYWGCRHTRVAARCNRVSLCGGCYVNPRDTDVIKWSIAITRNNDTNHHRTSNIRSRKQPRATS